MVNKHPLPRGYTLPLNIQPFLLWLGFIFHMSFSYHNTRTKRFLSFGKGERFCDICVSIFFYPKKVQLGFFMHAEKTLSHSLGLTSSVSTSVVAVIGQGLLCSDTAAGRPIWYFGWQHWQLWAGKVRVSESGILWGFLFSNGKFSLNLMFICCTLMPIW